MSLLTPTQQRTLEAICETLLPSLSGEDGEPDALLKLRAGDLDLARSLEDAIEALTDDDGRRRALRLLNLLERRWFNGLLAGKWRAFSQLAPPDRESVLQVMALSPVVRLRAAFSTLKRLAMFLFYTPGEEEREHPAWPVLDYPPKPAAHDDTSPRAPRLRMTSISGPATLSADVLIIGSGAGGGVMAAELTAAGKDVLVVEKGRYFADSDFPRSERTGLHELYERRGSLTTADRAIVVLAGSTVGGGTAVNWTTSLRPPDYVLEEWSRELGFHAATSAELQASLDAVSQRIHVNTFESVPNAQNDLLEQGCRSLGYRCEAIPRNVRGCVDCDYCGFGCRYGAKQDTRNTFLKDAVADGARILPRAHAERITHQAGRATGARLTVLGDDGAPHSVTVRAKSVIVAAGSIHTPALLIRSGLENRNIGQHLRLHPTTAVFARYRDPVHSWHGPPQTRYCDQLANLDDAGYGVRLETCPAHPGLWALALPWQSAAGHKAFMRQLPYLGNIIVLTRDRYGGSVQVNAAGQPELHYRVHPYDANHLMTGALAALRVQIAAGAEEVFSPHQQNLSFRPGRDGEAEDYLRRVWALGVRRNLIGLFSAHQLSTCRIAGNPQLGAVNPAGETYDVKNLFVADGSVLPSASGVNPMLTIMGLAHYMAQQVKAVL